RARLRWAEHRRVVRDVVVPVAHRGCEVQPEQDSARLLGPRKPVLIGGAPMIRRWLFVAGAASAIAAPCFLLAGCGSPYGMVNRGWDARPSATPPDMKALIGFDPADMMAQQKLAQDMQTDPDLPAWHDQREKMALAIGDRVFDKSFDRTFDSMII